MRCKQCSYCTSAIHCEWHSLRNVEHSILRAAETDANFISLYILFQTSIQCKFCIIRMRLINFTIWYNYVIIICWNARVATTARSHYIKKKVLKFVKRRFDDLTTFLIENSNSQLIRTNSICLSLFIQRSRILSIFRSITRKIRICFYKEFLFL